MLLEVKMLPCGYFFLILSHPSRCTFQGLKEARNWRWRTINSSVSLLMQHFLAPKSLANSTLSLSTVCSTGICLFLNIFRHFIVHHTCCIDINLSFHIPGFSTCTCILLLDHVLAIQHCPCRKKNPFAYEYMYALASLCKLCPWLSLYLLAHPSPLCRYLRVFDVSFVVQIGTGATVCLMHRTCGVLLNAVGR